MANTLYLSYDGLTDPLGQSQVVPYIVGLARRGYCVHVVSFEKKPLFATAGEGVATMLREVGIRWHPMTYTKNPPVISTIADVFRLHRIVLRLHATHHFALVHCRSYVTSLVGLYLKRRHNVPFLFDMRGFWADEKVEGGSWDLRNAVFRTVYRYFKKKEYSFIRHADGIVSLTEAGKREIEGWESYRASGGQIVVIPCSVDFELFAAGAAAERRASRAALGIPLGSVVMAYAGSIGSWYMLDEMFELFAAVRAKYDNARFLILTPAPAQRVRRVAEEHSIRPDDLVIRSVSRRDLAGHLQAADFGVSFIRPSYSKKSSSPTKLGEYLATGLPVVTNSGVGDVEEIVNDLHAGIVVHDFSAATLQRVADNLDQLLEMNRDELRTRSRGHYDLDTAVDRYADMYGRLLRGRDSNRADVQPYAVPLPAGRD